MRNRVFYITIILFFVFSLGCAINRNGKLLASDDVPSSVEKIIRPLAEKQNLFISSLKNSKVVYIGTEIVRQKSETGKDSPIKIYRTIHYRYSDDAAIFSLVNPDKQTVLKQRAIPHFPVSLAREELDTAKALALADPKVKKSLGENVSRIKVEALVIRPFSEKDPWFGHRVIRLLFKDGRNYRHNPKVIVDLTKKNVLVEIDEGFNK